MGLVLSTGCSFNMHVNSCVLVEVSTHGPFTEVKRMQLTRDPSGQVWHLLSSEVGCQQLIAPVGNEVLQTFAAKLLGFCSSGDS